jgi:predicted Fe-S protein YdhL (DUF1289 family)
MHEQEQRVPSPCVSLCRIDRDSELCVGCLRTRDEIAAWRDADDAFRRAVWIAIAERRQHPPDVAEETF